MGFCGTGLGNFPQPGDPSNNDVILSATSGFGGIHVSWTYPGLNPEAVAHTIVYRSTNGDPQTKVRYRTINGDYFFDATTTETVVEYFYWIEVVSVHGTVGDLIGPESATAKPLLEDYLALLTGEITSSQLGQSLTERIDAIQLLDLDLASEITDRINGDSLIGTELTNLQTTIDNVGVSLTEEITTRLVEDSVIIQSVNALDAVIADPSTGLVAAHAAVINEQTARADADTVLANSIDTVRAEVEDPSTGLAAAFAAVQSEQTARIDGDTALTSQYNTLISVVNDPESGNAANYAAIQSLQDAVGTDNSALVTDVETLQAVVNDPVTGVAANYAAIENEKTARANQDSALSNEINTLEAVVNSKVDSSYVASQIQTNNTAMVGYCSVGSHDTPSACLAAGGTWYPASPLAESVKKVAIETGSGTAALEQSFQALYNDVDNLNAEYMVKLDVNGYVSGFGLSNNGATSDAIFNVDNFSIGKLGATDILPFMVQDSQVFLNDAVINKLEFDKLRATDGSLIVENGKIKANYISVVNDIESDTYSPGVQGWSLSSDGSAVFNDVTIYDDNGDVAFHSGSTVIPDLGRINNRSITVNPDMTMVDINGKPAGYHRVWEDEPNVSVRYYDAAKTIMEVYSPSSSDRRGVVSTLFPVTQGAKYKAKTRTRLVNNSPAQMRFYVYATGGSSWTGTSKYVVGNSVSPSGEIASRDSYFYFDTPAEATVGTSWVEFEGEFTIDDPAIEAVSLVLVQTDYSNYNEDFLVSEMSVSEVTWEDAGDLAKLDQVSTTHIANAAVGTLNLDGNSVSTIQSSERTTTASVGTNNGTAWATIVSVSLPSELTNLNEVMPFIILPFGKIVGPLEYAADVQFRVRANPSNSILYESNVYSKSVVPGSGDYNILEMYKPGGIGAITTNPTNYGNDWVAIRRHPEVEDLYSHNLPLKMMSNYVVEAPVGTTSLSLQVTAQSHGGLHTVELSEGAGMTVIGMQR